jgi:hypothetical protein
MKKWLDEKVYYIQIKEVNEINTKFFIQSVYYYWDHRSVINIQLKQKKKSSYLKEYKKIYIKKSSI